METPPFARMFAKIGLAITLAQLGRDEEARAELAETAPDDETSATIFAGCLTARLAMRAGRPAEGIEAIDACVAAADRARRPFVRLLSRVVRAELHLELGSRGAEHDLAWADAAIAQLGPKGRVVHYVGRLRLVHAAVFGSSDEIDVARQRCIAHTPAQERIAEVLGRLGRLRLHPAASEVTTCEAVIHELRSDPDRTLEHRATIATMEQLLSMCASTATLERAVIVDAHGRSNSRRTPSLVASWGRSRSTTSAAAGSATQSSRRPPGRPSGSPRKRDEIASTFR